MILKVGLVGGIGSGKSTVCRMFTELGIPVYNVDDSCKQLIVENRQLRSKVVDIFGARAYLQNGEYNRTFVAGIVFSDAEKKKQLESAVSSYLFEDFNTWVDEMDQTKDRVYSFVLVECAYFYELDMDHWVDLMIGIDTPEWLRLERAMKRDEATEEQVRRRMNAQWPQEKVLERCDFILDGTKVSLTSGIDPSNERISYDGNEFVKMFMTLFRIGKLQTIIK